MLDPDVILSTMTLEQKAAQMVMAGFSGYSASSDIQSLIRRGLGGVILFAHNIQSQDQVAALTHELQAWARECHDVPLFISVDQEGGIVVRLTQDFPVFPGNMALGATHSEQLAYQAALSTGQALIKLGINMNLAPVLDVNNNPSNPVIGVRSYGEDPEWVAALGAAQVRGYQDAGVVATAKHFPGHGDTSVDSHHALPLVPHRMDRLEAVELVPFRAAIQAHVAAIMTAHVAFLALDPDGHTPATLSHAVLTGLLRQRLGFTGLIVTDSMGMKAISTTWPPGEAAVQAVLAGADLLTIGHGHDIQIGSIDGLIKAVQDGRLPESRLDESVRRIVTLKNQMCKDTSTTLSNADIVTPHAVAQQAVTVIRDNGVLPLSPDITLLLVEPDTIAHVGEAGTAVLPSMAEFLAPTIAHINTVYVPQCPSQQDIAQVVRQSEGCRVAIVVTRYASRQPAQAALVDALAATGLKVVVAALPNPYDAKVCPSADAVVTAYDVHRAAVQATCDVLLGKAPASGRLPVRLQ